MAFHNVAQNTDEPCPCCGKTWMELRAGKVTGSSISKVMANYGKAFGEPAKKLAVDIAVCELGGSVIQNEYTNAHMERGHEQEPIARMLYEDTYFTDVTNGGFFDSGREGCSPDGLVGSDGVVEIKSVVNSTHYKCLSNNTFDSAYKWQLNFNLMESGRDWIDFVSFCSTFSNDKRLFVLRLWVDDCYDTFGMIDNRLFEFYELVDNIKHKIRG